MRAVVARVLRDRGLRRVELGLLAFSFSEHATWLAILVYALERSGPRAVGVVAALQLLPGVLLAPLASYAGDRFPPQRALGMGFVAQSTSMAVSAVAMWCGWTMVAYVAAGAAATCITFTRPAMGALLPTITHAPADLVAANVVSGFIEQVGVFAGPLCAGALMVVWSPTAVFAMAAVAVGAGSVAVLRLHPLDEFTPDGELTARAVARQVFAGFATLRRHPRLRVLILLGALAGFVKGIGDVVFVTFADHRLHGGGGSSSLLAGAYGIGALVGAASTTRLVRSGRVRSQFLIAGTLGVAALAAMAGAGGVATSLVVFCALGAGETLLSLTASISIQREAPPVVMARVFGILESLVMGAIALGSAAITAFAAWTTFGRGFLLAAATLTVLVVLGVWRLAAHGDDPTVVDDALVQCLLADPVLAPLPAPTIERLARQAVVDERGAGEVIVREGDQGDHYFVVREGTLRVQIGGELVRELGPGRAFGEIALLRDVPRTATVSAVSDVTLVTIDRDAFLEAVTGHPRSLRLASEVAERFLAT